MEYRQRGVRSRHRPQIADSLAKDPRSAALEAGTGLSVARRPSQLSGGRQRRVKPRPGYCQPPALPTARRRPSLRSTPQKLRRQMQLELNRSRREVGLTPSFTSPLDQEGGHDHGRRHRNGEAQGRIEQLGSPAVLSTSFRERLEAQHHSASRTSSPDRSSLTAAAVDIEGVTGRSEVSRAASLRCRHSGSATGSSPPHPAVVVSRHHQGPGRGRCLVQRSERSTSSPSLVSDRS
jgi:hypothetical protein